MLWCQALQHCAKALQDRVTKRTGIATTRDNVLITPGGQAGLFATHMAACDPGDTALYLDPYYTTYPGTLRAQGLVSIAGSNPIKARVPTAARRIG
jgi:arginine:pyruvate transaminase